jgi:glutaredoxin
MNQQIQRLLEDIKNNGNKKVVLYTMTHCPACKELKNKLNHLNITYENVEMEGNDDVWKILKEEGGKDYVPQVRIEKKLINDFDTVNDLIGLVISEMINRKVIIK